MVLGASPLNVNDLEQRLNESTSSIYADDTSRTYSAEDIDDICNGLRTEVDNIAEWLRQNKLSTLIKQNTWSWVTKDNLTVSMVH